MDKRTLTLTLGVLLLFPPLLSAAVAYQYFALADAGQDESPYFNRGFYNISHTDDESKWTIRVDGSWNYMSIGIAFNECCRELQEGDAAEAIITIPNGKEYELVVEYGENHCKDVNCEVSDDIINPLGVNWIVLVDAPEGDYEITIKPSGSLERIPNSQESIKPIGSLYDDLENSRILLGNNIWWYYPDGSKKFVEDGGYFSWSDATPRIAVLGTLSMAGWTTGIVLLVKARRLRKE